MRISEILLVVSIGIIVATLLSTGAEASRMMGGGMMGEGKMCSMMGRMPKTGVDPKNLPEANSDAAKTYSKFCSQCHALPSPQRNSAENWKTLVNRMDSRTRIMSRIGGGMMGRGRVKAMSSSEKKRVIAYLQKHGLKTLDKSTISSTDTPEFKTFERVCSQCHDLPDPSLHTKSDWSQVVRKMKNNMKEMEMSQPSVEEEKLLLKFLQDAAGG